VYEGVELVRTVALFDHNVLDVFDVSSAGEHTYDYVLHIDGETRLEGPASGVPLKFRQEEGPLGSKCGYQWITGVRRTATDGLLAFSTAPPDAPQWVTVNLLPEKGTEAILADGITNRVDKKTPVFIARRKGKSTRFVGVFCPGSRVMQVGPPVIRKAGDSSFVSEDWNHHEAYLFLPPAPAETTWGPFSCAALAAAFRQGFFDATEQRPITQTDLVKATRCALGDLRFEFSGPTSLYLAVVPHSLTIQTGLDAGARIMVKGLATEHIQAQKVEPAGKADIPVTRGDGAISFNLSPLSHYEVRY
jgi:hypothetical protein